VIDIYASCGNSGIFQYAPGGDIEEVSSMLVRLTKKAID
jgi:hypothetical protein